MVQFAEFAVCHAEGGDPRISAEMKPCSLLPSWRFRAAAAQEDLRFLPETSESAGGSLLRLGDRLFVSDDSRAF